MNYAFNDKYINDKSFDLKQAILVVAQTVASASEGYHAALITPKKGVTVKESIGELTGTSEQKQQKVAEVLQWIWDNSEIYDLFSLFIDGPEPRPAEEDTAKFDHHDDTCCWFLRLTTEEFSELQSAFSQQGLPTDLFEPIEFE